MLVHERSGDVFMGNVKCDVKFQNLESMTKKWSSEIFAEKKTHFLADEKGKMKVTSVTCEIFVFTL